MKQNETSKQKLQTYLFLIKNFTKFKLNESEYDCLLKKEKTISVQGNDDVKFKNIRNENEEKKKEKKLDSVKHKHFVGGVELKT